MTMPCSLKSETSLFAFVVLVRLRGHQENVTFSELNGTKSEMMENPTPGNNC